jgi:hypothetical protein
MKGKMQTPYIRRFYRVNFKYHQVARIVVFSSMGDIYRNPELTNIVKRPKFLSAYRLKPLVNFLVTY